MNASIEIREDLAVVAEQRVIARLMPDEALNLAGLLARRAFGRIAVEEGVDGLLMDEGRGNQGDSHGE